MQKLTVRVTVKIVNFPLPALDAGRIKKNRGIAEIFAISAKNNKRRLTISGILNQEPGREPSDFRKITQTKELFLIVYNFSFHQYPGLMQLITIGEYIFGQEKKTSAVKIEMKKLR